MTPAKMLTCGRSADALHAALQTAWHSSCMTQRSGRLICHDFFTEAPQLGAQQEAVRLPFKSPLVSPAHVLNQVAEVHSVSAGAQLCRHRKAPAEEWTQVRGAP